MARVEADLKDAQTSVELLVEENEALRLASTETKAILESTRASLAEKFGTVSTLQAQLQASGDQVAAARSEAEAARQGLAISREQLHAADERCSHVGSELSVTRQELLEARHELTQSRKEAESARGEAAELQAQLSSKQQVEDYLKETAAKAQRHQQDLEDARQRLSRLEVERTSLGERLAETRDALTRAEATVQQLLDKVLSGTSSQAGATGMQT